ncbi:hypothetical protein ACU4GI_32945 [Cupriavidus basilensis]
MIDPNQPLTVTPAELATLMRHQAAHGPLSLTFGSRVQIRPEASQRWAFEHIAAQRGESLPALAAPPATLAAMALSFVAPTERE